MKNEELLSSGVTYDITKGQGRIPNLPTDDTGAGGVWQGKALSADRAF